MKRRKSTSLVAALGLSLALGSTAAVVPAFVVAQAAAPTAAAASLALMSPAAPRISEFARQLESKYVDPDRIYSSDVRWWLGEASNTDETLLEEIQKLYDGGYRGVELTMQNDNVAPNVDYAYGSKMWTRKWTLIMNKLLDLGMSVYLTSGTNWATSNVPGLDPTSQAAMQNLTLGTGTVAAGQTLSSLPAPAANAQRAGARFVTAYAYKVTEGNTVDPNTYVKLTPTQGADVWTQNVNWTVPMDGTYRVFSIWTQGTYQAASPATEPSYATNYFDTRGVDALKAFWEKNYLADPALKAKIAQGDVQLFMDSLEITYGTGGFTWWSEDMAAEFQKRKGYDITPNLFLISGVAASVSNPYNSPATTGTYKLAGAEDRRQRIINDYQDVITQLYRERMLQPLKKWLNSVGIETRAQISYGKPVEISEPSMDVDYPEAENLNQYNQVDIFRLWSGAAKLENKVLSSESSAQLPAFNATAQARLRDAYSTYAAGFQRMIWHVWASDYGYGNDQWPAYSPWYGFGNSTTPNQTQFPFLGGRNPGARDYDEFNAHLGRIQQLMQTGKSRTDVGFVHQNWTQGVRFGGGVGSDNTAMNWQLAQQGIYYRSTELQENGYTYDYFSPRFLFDDDVSFDEKTKTIEKSGYKAIVLYQKALDIQAARRILTWAKKGLKVVVLEDAASKTPFNDGKDSALKKVTDELKTLPTVRTATVYDNIDYESSAAGGYQDNVLEKLNELGVKPYAGYQAPNRELLNQTREDADGNKYVYLYNYDDGSYRDRSLRPEIRNAAKPGLTTSTKLEMDGQYVPYVIDAWTGKVTELAEYQWKDGKTVVPVDLAYNNVALMAFEKVDDATVRITDTNAESAFATTNGVAVRATESGRVSTILSDGRQFQDAVTVPASYDITNWNLRVQSWRPGTAGGLVRTETIDGLTTTNKKATTAITPIDVNLNTLTTWDKIPQVGKAVSGTGRYTATFDWNADTASGAYLDFGDKLEESMEVWINGKKVGGQVSTNPTKVRKDVGGLDKPTIDDGTGTQVPLVGTDLYTGGVSWTNPVADISSYLVDGQNDIVIEYSSVLSNVQLDRGIITPGQNRGGWWQNNQDYLSFGPAQARIVPFVEVEYPSAAQPTTSPTPTATPTPTTTPTPTPPVVEPKVRVKSKVQAGKKVRIRVSDLSVNKVSITLGGKKLGTVKVKDGKVSIVRVVPKNLSGKAVLRVLDRKGEVLVRTTVRVVKRKAS